MLSYSCKHFDELSLEELYQIIQLRIEVFCVEQNCPYQDCDGKDIGGYHVMGKDEFGKVHAYTRLLAKGVSYDHYTSIGRVVNSQQIRGKGEGKRLMQFSIDTIKSLYPDQDIKISAQTYLLAFYTDLGFKVSGEPYLEDGIPHTPMVLLF